MVVKITGPISVGAPQLTGDIVSRIARWCDPATSAKILRLNRSCHSSVSEAALRASRRPCARKLYSQAASPHANLKAMRAAFNADQNAIKEMFADSPMEFVTCLDLTSQGRLDVVKFLLEDVKLAVDYIGFDMLNFDSYQMDDREQSSSSSVPYPRTLMDAALLGSQAHIVAYLARLTNGDYGKDAPRFIVSRLFWRDNTKVQSQDQWEKDTLNLLTLHRQRAAEQWGDPQTQRWALLCAVTSGSFKLVQRLIDKDNDNGNATADFVTDRELLEQAFEGGPYWPAETQSIVLFLLDHVGDLTPDELDTLCCDLAELAVKAGLPGVVTELRLRCASVADNMDSRQEDYMELIFEDGNPQLPSILYLRDELGWDFDNYADEIQELEEPIPLD
ncbi:hypothetical protein HDU89_007159 [Geranomyces variabilis]|nr:hypothetical protein HDU89_007159 [Geranomyces variabilis]